MADFQLTSGRLIIAGIGAVVTGILLAVGEDVYHTAKAWIVSPSFDLRFFLGLIVAVVGIVVILYGIRAMRKAQESKLISVSASQFDAIQPLYETALIFKIRSSTDWFGVGVVDSKGVKVVECKASKDAQVQIRQIPDPNLSYFRVDQEKDTESELIVAVGFAIHPSSHHTIFLRKGDDGNLKVDVFNRDRKHLGGYEYKLFQGFNIRWNYVEFRLERK